MNDVFNPFTSFPNITKGAIGFDDIFKRLTEYGEGFPKFPTYPPYNIRKLEENKYIIEVAVAGFGRQDLELTLENGVLTIKGQITNDDSSSNYVFKGIGSRAFTRKFTLADTVEIKNADLINGMLEIILESFVKKADEPKKIKIGDGKKV